MKFIPGSSGTAKAVPVVANFSTALLFLDEAIDGKPRAKITGTPEEFIGLAVRILGKFVPEKLAEDSKLVKYCRNILAVRAQLDLAQKIADEANARLTAMDVPEMMRPKGA